MSRKKLEDALSKKQISQKPAPIKHESLIKIDEFENAHKDYKLKNGRCF